MEQVVDTHTHLLPARLAAAIRGFFDAHLPATLAYPLDHRTVLDRLAAVGIASAWTLPYAHRPGVAADLNAVVVALARDLADHPVEVVPGCTAHPGDPDPAGDVARAADAGARVVKLHCSVGRYDADDAALTGALDVAGARGLPVVVHAGHAIDGTTGAGEMAPLARAAARHPATTFVIAHLGAPAEAAATAVMDAHQNVWADLTPVIDRLPALDAATAVCLGDRLLFGSDAPNVAVDAGAALDRLAGLGVPDAVLDAITGGNARRLLGGSSAPPARD